MKSDGYGATAMMFDANRDPRPAALGSQTGASHRLPSKSCGRWVCGLRNTLRSQPDAAEVLLFNRASSRLKPLLERYSASWLYRISDAYWSFPWMVTQESWTEMQSRRVELQASCGCEMDAAASRRGLHWCVLKAESFYNADAFSRIHLVTGLEPLRLS